MISDFFYSIYLIIKSRVFIVSVVFLGLLGILAYRLFDLQIVNEEYYSQTYELQAERTIYTAGTRGQILDAKGNVLAYNKLTYTVTFEDVLKSSDDKNKKLNEISYNAIDLIEKNGDSISVDFPIYIDEDGNYQFSSSSESAKKTLIINIFGKEALESKKRDYLKASAAEVYQQMCDEKFKIDKNKYDEETRFKIAKLRYNVYLNSYQKYVPVTIAKNVSNATMVAIYENEGIIPGVTINRSTTRVYNYSEYFAPIMGYTGTISYEQMESMNEGLAEDDESRYINTDVVGKAGIEAAMEDKLRGKRGVETIFTDSTGNKISTVSKTDSAPGNNVVLTLDLNLQKATYDLLEKKIAGILVSQIVNYDVNKDKEDEKDEHPIGIKEVYFQLLNNNVVSLSELKKKRTSNEEKVYNKYKNSVKTAKSTVKSIMDDDTSYDDLSKEKQDYIEYIYEELKTDNIVIKSAIKTDDKTYQKWADRKMSFKKYLKYAITNEWVNISELHDNTGFSTTDETYEQLKEYVNQMLEKNTAFGKRVMYYRIYDGTVSGSEICMLLYDQKVLEMDESSYNTLATYDKYKTYTFITNQIKKLKITPAQIALDPCSGSVVVTDPNSGKVLALVTYPSYDNNKLSGTVDPDYWSKLVEDESDPLYNRATQGLTAPGSTFKMVSSITALEEGVLSGPNSTIKTKGIFEEITPSPKCWIYNSGHSTHGTINVKEALAYSCNYFFYDVGYKLGTNSKGKYDSDRGLKKIKKYADMLGLTSNSGVEITESDPKFSTESAVHSAIGQGSHSYAPVQIARYMSTLANGGKNYKLTLIDKITDVNSEVVSDVKPELTNKVELRDSTWDAVHEGMRMVVTKGTVKSIFKDMKIDVAGKSGTAEESSKRNAHGLFVAYAPYNKPEISVVTVIPFANSSGTSAELTRDVIKYYFGEINLKDVDKSEVSTNSERTND
ncbi:MAG: penicillin-binding protein [Lachnospiraceae bacterium]|nr:penicillin-binding protein [Lachnospiraceae bacterium]